LDDKIKKNEMGGACRNCGGENSCIQGFGEETLGKDHLEDPGVDGMIILRWVFRKWDGKHGLD
jgi:hypothetical protein